ncbi:hypothetical protein K2F43_16375 [Clostridium estertheticum]|uniref:hypothetical protein n=1 Tax=Clostridium estertheticum TaxID=238834 RepID=UPI001C6F3EB6|nr:hypothetical protein [Clostridium estertheticum]MBW9172783.1 hypothetical protein [Clostridium estertheticum]WLC77688.1 hypothetical protein KTC99_22280 [Clostridium estertheticum]
MNYGKIVGVGNTATVYEWKESKVIKLFYQGYPKEAVEKEFHNAKAISNMDFAKPKVYEIVFFEERIGIIYDKVEGESLLDCVLFYDESSENTLNKKAELF